MGKMFPEDTLLHDAIRMLDYKKINLLLNKKEVDINAKTKGGTTALHLAIILRINDDIIKRLVETNADINAINDSGNTVLHHCVITQNIRVLSYLLFLKANKHIKNNNGETPLDLAYKVKKLGYSNAELLISLLKN